MHIKESFIHTIIFLFVFSEAIPAFSYIFFAKEQAKKDAASIGAIVYDNLESLLREG